MISLRRTRRDLNGGFITECSNPKAWVYLDRYTTQPITVSEGTLEEYIGSGNKGWGFKPGVSEEDVGGFAVH